ncbi:MAG: T9SS type A sorting domain-containing protein [Bacteroidota bacterium]
MRNLYIVLFLVFSATAAFGQATGDYRSVADGNWSSAATWEVWSGSAWLAAGNPPNGSEVITIQVEDSVAIDVAVAIVDTLIYRGHLTGGPNLTIGDGGVFQYDRNAGSLPDSTTWATGSTYYLTGITSTAPSNRNQDFYDIVINTPNMASNRDLGFDSTTVYGDITVIATGTGSIRWQMCAPLAGDTTIAWIHGDIIQQGGAFSSNGTSNANSHVIIHHYGNTIVTGGNFSVGRGSQGGTGTVRWHLYGDLSMSNATTQNSNSAGARFVFAKQGVQNLDLGAGNTLTAFPMVIDSGATVNMGLSKLRGSGRFELDADGSLATAEPGGLDSAVVVTGTVALDSAAAYIFNGTTGNQVTGLTLPAKVRMLVNENPDTLILSQATTIYGPLILRDGIFNNTIPFDLGATGWIVFDGGNLLLGVPTSAGTEESTIPASFYVGQNYPNPFNPATVIRYGLPTASNVSANVFNMLGQKVATVFEGRKEAGTHELRFNAANLPSGVYLLRVQAGGHSTVQRMVLMK